MLTIFPQPVFELDRAGGAAPVIGQRLDLDPEGFGAHTPVEREKSALDHQHLVARRKQIDQRRLPGPVSGGGIGEDRLLGLEYSLKAGEALLGDLLELCTGEVDRAAVHRAQDAVWDIGWPGVLIKMVSAADRHFSLHFHFQMPPLAACASYPRPAQNKNKEAGPTPASFRSL